jgi:hypothetical protein
VTFVGLSEILSGVVSGAAGLLGQLVGVVGNLLSSILSLP